MHNTNALQPQHTTMEAASPDSVEVTKVEVTLKHLPSKAEDDRSRGFCRLSMSHECRASGSGCEKHSEQHAIADGVELETDQRLLEGGSFIETDAESPREDNNR